MKVTIPPGFRVTPEQFDRLAEVEDINKLELTKDGELIVMPPTGGDTGIKNSRLNLKFGIWAERDGTGVVFDSSTLFILPNGARRSPDLSWILKSRWNQLTKEQKRKFPPIAPDFVIELVSPSDTTKFRYEFLQNKMQEYMDNGVRLGWLIDPENKVVEIYRLNQPVEVIQNSSQIESEDVLKGFSLDLTKIFN